MKGLILLDDIDKRKTLSLNLELYTDVKLKSLGNADYCADYLTTNCTIDLIVCQNKIGDENTVMKVAYYIKSKHLNIPIICIGPCPKFSGEENILILEDKLDIPRILKWTAQKLGITAESMAQKDLDDFYPFCITNFQGLRDANVPIFKFEDEINGFQEVIEEGSEIPEDFFRNNFLKGVNYCYVLKKDRLKFVNHLTDHALQIINSPKRIDKKDFLGAANQIYESAKLNLNEVGFDERTKELAKESTKAIMTIINSETKLIELLKMLEENESDYGFKKSVLVSAVVHRILKAINWNSKSQLECISFVAFFHDILLLDEKLIKIRSDYELKTSGLTPEEIKQVNEHAFKTAQLINEIDKIPFGALEIITQHHGTRNGIGFSNKTSNNISGLAALFRVAEDYVHAFLNDEKFKHDKVIKDLKNTYKHGVYSQAVYALKK